MGRGAVGYTERGLWSQAICWVQMPAFWAHYRTSLGRSVGGRVQGGTECKEQGRACSRWGGGCLVTGARCHGTVSQVRREVVGCRTPRGPTAHMSSENCPSDKAVKRVKSNVGCRLGEEVVPLQSTLIGSHLEHCPAQDAVVWKGRLEAAGCPAEWHSSEKAEGTRVIP